MFPSRPRPTPALPSRSKAQRFLHVVLALVLLACPPALADEIPVRSADLRVEEGEVLLSAQFDVALTPALEQALQKGIPLYFVVEFQLTRQYRVSSGPLSQPFDALDDVLRFVGRVSSRPVARADMLTRGARYEAALRMRLDSSQLPKPFQLNALASHEWQLAS